MKFVKLVGCLFLGALILVSCQKEYSVETGGLGGTIGTSQWEFKQGVIQYKGTMDTAKIDTVASIAYLTLSGTSDSSNQLISLTVFGTQIKAGTYTSPAVAFTYTDLASNIIYQSDVTATNFTLLIAKIDSTGVTGTFSGTVKDATSLAKIVTSGKFSASFKKTRGTTTPGTSNCKLEKIFQYDSIGVARGPITIFTYNTSKTVTKTQLVDSFSNRVLNTFNFSFPANKIQLDAKQYFVTDPASGRVTQFYGYENPIDDSTDQIIATYTYNAAGQLIRRNMAYAAAPAVTILETDYTWSGNNLTKAVGKVPVNATLSLTVFDVTYQYDATKTVKSFITLPAYAYEIVFFQSAVNSGAVPVNPVTKTTSRYYNQSGTGAVTATYTCNFIKYSIDANNYVQSFVTSGDNFNEALIFRGRKYVFGYKCF